MGAGLMQIGSDDALFGAAKGSTTGAIASLRVIEHTEDTTDAHDASAISIVDAGGLYTGTDVEAALQEVGGRSGWARHFLLMGG